MNAAVKIGSVVHGPNGHAGKVVATYRTAMGRQAVRLEYDQAGSVEMLASALQAGTSGWSLVTP